MVIGAGASGTGAVAERLEKIRNEERKQTIDHSASSGQSSSAIEKARTALSKFGVTGKFSPEPSHETSFVTGCTDQVVGRIITPDAGPQGFEVHFKDDTYGESGKWTIIRVKVGGKVLYDSPE